MASVTIQLNGFRELGERMRALSNEVNLKLARATTNAGAQVIKKLAIRYAPGSDPSETPRVPPDNLKKNIIVRRRSKPKYTSEHAVTVRSKGKGVIGNPYTTGVQQEFGNVNHGPQAFMRPALDQGKQAALDAMKKKLADGIRKASK